MLELQDIEVGIPGREDLPCLLKKISLFYPAAHLGAVIGPSGCGKSSLLKCISGILVQRSGRLLWSGRDLTQSGADLEASELGYVPQFSIFHEDLTVSEIIRHAASLRLGGLSQEERRERILGVLSQVGLAEIMDRRARVLSGGQRRRLGLAIELVSDPALLLCDEVTSGLDPKSEDEIVGLLHHLSQTRSRTVIHVTHSLRHMHYYHSITVMYEGVVAYQGPPEQLLEYFGVESREDIFSALALGEPEFWESKNKDMALMDARFGNRTGVSGTREDGEKTVETFQGNSSQASALTQLMVLFFRRCLLFSRERGQWVLQLLLLLTFPALVVLFGYKGLPQIRNMNLGIQTDVLAIIRERLEFTLQMSQVGTLVSGLIMFEVILLALMAANNGAREAAAERMIWEKEKLSGVSTVSYVASKLLFLGILVLVQSFWMTAFVKTICGFPGGFASQFLLLLLLNAAITTTCFAISSWSRSVEQASLISIYLVGFQLPLSGAVLALPTALGEVIRPFVAAYWSWSGMLQTMKETRLYDVVLTLTQTPLSAEYVCVWMLAMHVLVMTVFSLFGCYRSQWNLQS